MKYKITNASQDYAREYIRLSLLGVNNINSLTECTKVLPAAVKGFKSPDQVNLDKWLNSNNQSPLVKLIAATIEKGDSIIAFVINLILGIIL